MYYEYFGLKQPPFRITPDTRLFYPGGNRGAVLEALVYAIGNGEGIVKVVGEVGSGKTMLCRMLEQELPKHVEIVYLANPSLSPDIILHAIAHELKLPQAAGTPRIQVMNALQEYLLRRHGEGRQIVVFVEEAQGMPLETLEEVRLLSNLETGSSKLLQIVLFGQPELDEHMARREIRQLKERVTYSFHLGPFSQENIAEYLNARVRACGYRSGELFSDGAIRAIRKFSTGLVRRVNILADKSLLAAYADNSHAVEARHVRRAAQDSEFVPRAAFYRNPVIGGVLAVLLVAGAGVAIWGFRTQSPADSSATVAATVAPDIDEQKPEVPPPQELAPAVEAAAAKMELPEETTDTAPPVSGVPPPTATPSMTEAIAPHSGGSGVPAEPATVEVPTPESAASEDAAAESVGDAEVMAPQDPGPGLPAEISAAAAAVPGQLLGMGAVFMLQDLEDPRLTTREIALLQQQLRDLPPEEAEQESLMSEIDGCRLCWSIIYRPLPISENL